MNSPEKRTPQNGQMLVSGCADRDSWNTQLLYFTCSSLSRDDRRIYLLSDRSGDPNVVVRDLLTGEERILTDNRNGTLKSYVYFDGTFNRGLGKASVCLDAERDAVYYIQDDCICRTDLSGTVRILKCFPQGAGDPHGSAREGCHTQTQGSCGSGIRI